MIIRFFTDGGSFMYAILAVSIFALAFIVEKYYSLHAHFAFEEEFFENVIRLIRAGDVNRAAAACQKTDHPLSRVILRVFSRLEHETDQVEERTTIEFQKIIPHIQKRTDNIQMLGNVSTLLGLLGTIYGLITSFSSLSQVSSTARAAALSQGISTAMNTTAFGLMVAIPCVVAHSFLSSQESVILQKYEATLNEFSHSVRQLIERMPDNKRSGTFAG